MLPNLRLMRAMFEGTMKQPPDSIMRYQAVIAF
jgi:hypothetical protein